MLSISQTDSISLPAKRVENGMNVFFSLIMRTLLFTLFGGLFVGLFALLGSEQPLKSAEKWWPYQAILANVATFFILRRFLRQEGLSYRSLIGFKRDRLRQDAGQFTWLLIISFVFGAVPLYAFSYLVLGNVIPPDLMFQPLPKIAAIIALLIFPITNALVETPTYIGYALPRIQKLTGNLWVAIIFAGLMLAFQHVALPLVFEGPYMLWRFLSFIPLALFLGVIFSRTQRLIPMVLAHFVMDLQLVFSVFIVSV